mmetsp:Transcript_53185/g.173012  ORF Transcript_53185/g.173012 Transcript_53185/m.173012 type:complete len:427 (-) Transcript_53185:15-1295(-)
MQAVSLRVQRLRTGWVTCGAPRHCKRAAHGLVLSRKLASAAQVPPGQLGDASDSTLVGHRNRISQLSAEIETYVAKVVSLECQAAQESLIQQVGSAASRVLDGCVVNPFGSAITGLWVPGSDLDLCVIVPGANDRHLQTRALRKIAGELRRAGASHHVLPRIGAQMPIVRWSPRREGGIACDISVNNALAVANSRLLAQYIQVDSRVRPLGLCIKFWASQRNINDRSQGTLSSFALTLMLIHFLQRRTPPILPSLQDLAVTRGYPPLFIQGADCRYCSRPSDVTAAMKQLKENGVANSESLDSLLQEFFLYFAHEYQRGTLAIRSRASFVQRLDEADCYLVVDNPFEPGKDVANVEVRHYTRLHEEFRRAWSILSSSGSFASACEPAAPPGQGDPLSGAARPFGFGGAKVMCSQDRSTHQSADMAF